MSGKKVWFITGAGRGMGVDIARAALAAGHCVVATGRSTDAVANAVGKTEDLLVAELDITSPASAGAAVHAALDRFDRIDVLLNNAGNFFAGFFEELSPEQFEAQLTTNLLGPFRLTKALLGSLAAAARDGRRPLVVNVSSDAAVTAYENWGAYGASKAALQHLSRIWNLELKGDGVSVVSIDPGDMDTALHELAIPGADRASLRRPEDSAHEIADLIAAHVSARARMSLEAAS